jgi:mono/diheme cytochrome c family protein
MTRRIALALCTLALIVVARPAIAQEAFVVDTTLVETGRRVFASKACSGCHTIGKGDLAAPDLGGLLERRSVNWVKDWLRDPTTMLGSDDTAKALLKQYNNLRMPNLKLSAKEIVALMHYIEHETRTLRSSASETR